MQWILGRCCHFQWRVKNASSYIVSVKHRLKPILTEIYNLKRFRWSTSYSGVVKLCSVRVTLAAASVVEERICEIYLFCNWLELWTEYDWRNRFKVGLSFRAYSCWRKITVVRSIHLSQDFLCHSYLRLTVRLLEAGQFEEKKPIKTFIENKGWRPFS